MDSFFYLYKWHSIYDSYRKHINMKQLILCLIALICFSVAASAQEIKRKVKIEGHQPVVHHTHHRTYHHRTYHHRTYRHARYAHARKVKIKIKR